jgi:hypothetical protein
VELPLRVAPGVVDEYVDRAELPACGLDHPVAILGRGEVSRNRQDDGTATSELTGDRSKLRFGARDQRHSGTSLGQGRGEMRSDPAGGDQLQQRLLLARESSCRP